MPIEKKIKNKKRTRSSVDFSKLSSSLNSNPKITPKDRMFFTGQLSLLLETGANLHAALGTLKSQLKKPAMINLVDDLANDISDGKTFSHALSRHKSEFSSTYISLIEASENGGFMHEVLKKLLEDEEKREELRSIIVSALTYPIFLVLFSIAVVVFVLVVVFPKFADMFESIHDKLPVTTKFLMSLSEFLTDYWIWVATALTVCIACVIYWFKTVSAQTTIDNLKLKLPFIRDIFIQLYLVQSMRVMGLSLSYGVSVMDTLSVCRDVIDNKTYRQFLMDLETAVQEGKGIAVGFKESTFMPEIVKQMISTGDDSGNLPKVMQRISEYYEQELSKKLGLISKLAEPIMLLLMGLIVGTIVSSLILPIFKLSQATH